MESVSRGVRSAVASRRAFLKAAAATAVAAESSLARAGDDAAAKPALERSVHAAGGGTLKFALIGCGGRGTGAAANLLSVKVPTRLTVMADAFPESLQRSAEALQREFKDRVDVPTSRRFTGLDAYKAAIAADVDLVLLCSPPGFRPSHFEAAVAAGRHVFMEKPLATDAPGVQRITAANIEAKKKRLAVAVGHHLRHEVKHREAIGRIREGAIGELVFLRAFFNSSGVWIRPRRPEQSELAYQVNNWYYFTWLSGDHIVEQHVHDLDVCNWIAGGHPVQAEGQGGRQVRVGKEFGEIFDHHAVEFTYADGVKLFSYCRHIPGCWDSFSQHAHGVKGVVDIEGHGGAVLRVKGEKPRKWSRGPDGHQVEMDDLVEAILKGREYNEADWAVESTMTAILGRMATYSGKIVTWDEAIGSKLDLTPKDCDSWNAAAKVKPGPDGCYACAKPGATRAW